MDASKWKTVGFTVETIFPVKGSELKEILEHLAVVEMLIYDSAKFEQWISLNPKLAANLDKLLAYSRTKNPQYKVAEEPAHE